MKLVVIITTIVFINVYRIFCAMGSKLMNAEKSTFMIDLHQVGMMLRYIQTTLVKFSLC